MIMIQPPPMVRLSHLIGLSHAHTARAKPPVASSSPALPQLLLKFLKRSTKAARAEKVQAALPGLLELIARSSVTTSPPPAIAAAWDAAINRARSSTRALPKSQSATARSWDNALKAARR